MTAHEYLNKHICTVEQGVAWKRKLFGGTEAHGSAALVDAAVDIVWSRLMPEASERPRLAVTREGAMIVFRLEKESINPLPKAA